jgi:hypothetical protein
MIADGGRPRKRSGHQVRAAPAAELNGTTAHDYRFCRRTHGSMDTMLSHRVRLVAREE